MKCGRCGEGKSKVIDSRPSENGARIVRRRQCLSCGKRWRTQEAREGGRRTINRALIQLREYERLINKLFLMRQRNRSKKNEGNPIS